MVKRDCLIHWTPKAASCQKCFAWILPQRTWDTIRELLCPKWTKAWGNKALKEEKRRLTKAGVHTSLLLWAPGSALTGLLLGLELQGVASSEPPVWNKKPWMAGLGSGCAMTSPAETLRGLSSLGQPSPRTQKSPSEELSPPVSPNAQSNDCFLQCRAPLV